MLLGAHVSTAGGMPNAVRLGLEIGCEVIQVFTRNQRQWEARPLPPDEVRRFRRDAREAGFLRTAVSHASYLINLCARDRATLLRSRRALVDEVRRCAALRIPCLCVHPGSHLGAGEEAGLALAAASVRGALRRTKSLRVKVLLENTAGQGTNLGHRLEHLAALLRLVRGRRVGVCVDTCHLFAAGYDLRSPRVYERTIREVARLPVRALHLNDSRFGLGSRRDRHENVGKGEIGAAAFRRLVNDARFARLPGLLETPGGAEADRDNLDRLRRMRA